MSQKKPAPLAPPEHPYLSSFVKYINARLYSFNNEVIRLTKSDLRPPSRWTLRCIDTHLGQPGIEPPLPRFSRIWALALWGASRLGRARCASIPRSIHLFSARKSLLVTRLTSSLQLYTRALMYLTKLERYECSGGARGPRFFFVRRQGPRFFL